MIVRMPRHGSTLALIVVPVAVLTACAAPSPDSRPHELASPSAADALIALSAADVEALRRAAAPALARLPDPLPVVHVEGTLPTTASYQRARQSSNDWTTMSTLASAFASTRDARYLERYAQYLEAWLAVYRISGNPIDETGLGDWLLAYRAAGRALPQSTRERMRAFSCELAARYQQAQPRGRTTSTNNWQSHRVKLGVMGAFACSDRALIDGAVAAFERQIRDNLLASGEAIDFYERDAIHYVLYSVEPLLEAALFANQNGRSLFGTTGPQGQSLGRTLDWLVPYARGERTHLEFVHSKVRFDAERAAAGVPGFAGPFDPGKARYAYWLAAQLDPRWTALDASLRTPPIARRAPWLVTSDR
jgi:hypothetical protein